MLLLAVFSRLEELVCVVCCLLCELGTSSSSSRWFCWPCRRAGKAYRRPRPPTLTPQVCIPGRYFTLELHVLYNIVVILPLFSVFSITEG